MKFRCTSKQPVAVIIEGDLTVVSEGQVIDVPRKPLGDFVAVDEAPKPVKKTVKKIPKKVTKNADTTETSSVW